MIQYLRDLSAQTPEATKLVGDAITAAAVIGTLVGYLPPLAAFFTIIWTVIRIMETRSMHRFIWFIKDHFTSLKAKIKALFNRD